MSGPNGANGSKPDSLGLVSQLAGETKTRIYNRTTFDVKSLDDMLKLVRSTGSNGTITLPFKNGVIGGTGVAEWEVKK